MSENNIKYKRLNLYTKAMLMSALTKQGTKIDIKNNPDANIIQNLNVNYHGTTVYTYTKYANNIDSIIVNGNIVATTNHDDESIKDLYNMLNKARILKERYNRDISDIRATEFLNQCKTI